MSSGFRIWLPADFEQPVRQGDAEEIEYTFFDFGVEKIVSDVPEARQCVGECGGIVETVDE